ncbi:uncharacterized protein LOC131005725 [Salvia miltiorrhiza]|uniref:uncharacterized protein LOC131005725 n=1 Tax=Salvia miltiorrhiza TaxID=226208 RepID=UPI0025ABD843|nr:uncharacterized protein LOC131005725 [Salvia miltiorrhiza]
MVLTWRLLKNRLPTCDNLKRRMVLTDEGECGCNGCLQQLETAHHAFLQCPKTTKVWDGILEWLGINFVPPQGVADHFAQFSHLCVNKRSENFLMALWSCTCWLIWKWRNESRWEGKTWEIPKAIMEIKARMWSWNKIFKIIEVDVSLACWMNCKLSCWLL